MSLAKALSFVAEAAERAARQLETTDVPSDSFQKKVMALWTDRENLVSGVSDLVRGLQGMHEILTSLSQRVDNLEIRIQTAETNIDSLRGRRGIDAFLEPDVPPPPPSLDGEGDETWMTAPEKRAKSSG